MFSNGIKNCLRKLYSGFLYYSAVCISHSLFFILTSNISVSDFSRVVYQSRNGESLFTHKSIISMCTLETMKLKSVPQYTELCESKVIKYNIEYGYGILCNMTSNHFKKSISPILIPHINWLRCFWALTLTLEHMMLDNLDYLHKKCLNINFRSPDKLFFENYENILV